MVVALEGASEGGLFERTAGQGEVETALLRVRGKWSFLHGAHLSLDPQQLPQE